MTKNAIVWIKSGSIDCQQAIKELKEYGYTVEERPIKGFADIQAMKAAVPNAKSVPQIIIDGALLGGRDAIATLPEAVAARSARAARAAPQHFASRAEAWTAKKTATAAKREESLGNPTARKAAWSTDPKNLNQNPTGTRAERKAAEAAKVQATKDRRAAAEPTRPLAPEGYVMGAHKNSPLADKIRRFNENKTERAAAFNAWHDSSRPARHAEWKANINRIAGVIAAQKAALSQ